MLWWPCESPLCLFLGRQRHTTMERAGNDLHLQFLGEADFGSVVAVKGDASKDGEEIALKLLVAILGNGVAVMPRANARWGTGFVQGAKQSALLRRRSVNEVFAEKIVAL